jgi:biopolymer transport protein ExbD
MAAGPAGGSGGAMAGWVMNLLTDLAFNLLIFFVVCASTAPEKGRPQNLPSSSQDKLADQSKLNVEVAIERTEATVNGEKVPPTEIVNKLKGLLAAKAKPEDRIVVVKSAKDVPYSQWIRVTGAIEQAGGVITLQLEEEKEVVTK